MNTKNNIDKICNNCFLYNRDKGECKVAVLIEGKEVHLPVKPQDKCVFDEIGIEIKQVRWWVEDDKGKPVDGNGTVKIEYPEGFFGPESQTF
jgi:hypothetical protein